MTFSAIGVFLLFCFVKIVTFQINWLDYFETLFEGIRDDARQLFENGEPIIIKNMKQFEATLRVLSEVSRKVFSMLMYNFETYSNLAQSHENFHRKIFNYKKRLLV